VTHSFRPLKASHGPIALAVGPLTPELLEPILIDPVPLDVGAFFPLTPAPKAIEPDPVEKAPTPPDIQLPIAIALFVVVALDCLPIAIALDELATDLKPTAIASVADAFAA